MGAWLAVPPSIVMVPPSNMSCDVAGSDRLLVVILPPSTSKLPLAVLTTTLPVPVADPLPFVTRKVPLEMVVPLL